MHKRKLIIAIDGANGTGKTTVARELSRRMGFKHINTGAIYRAIAHKMIVAGIEESSESEMILIAKSLEIDFLFKEQKSIILLGDVDITKKLYTPEVSALTVKIACNEKLRDVLLPVQRKFGDAGGIVVEGRDTTSVVFPNADWKFFITASFDVRLKRVIKAQSSDGIRYTKEDFAEMLKEWDYKDENRPIAPLIKTEDSIAYDNSHSPSEFQDVIVLEYYIMRSKEINENSKILAGY